MRIFGIQCGVTYKFIGELKILSLCQIWFRIKNLHIWVSLDINFKAIALFSPELRTLSDLCHLLHKCYKWQKFIQHANYSNLSQYYLSATSATYVASGTNLTIVKLLIKDNLAMKRVEMDLVGLYWQHLLAFNKYLFLNYCTSKIVESLLVLWKPFISDYCFAYLLRSFNV